MRIWKYNAWGCTCASTWNVKFKATFIAFLNCRRHDSKRQVGITQNSLSTSFKTSSWHYSKRQVDNTWQLYLHSRIKLAFNFVCACILKYSCWPNWFACSITVGYRSCVYAFSTTSRVPNFHKTCMIFSLTSLNFWRVEKWPRARNFHDIDDPQFAQVHFHKRKPWNIISSVEPPCCLV